MRTHSLNPLANLKHNFLNKLHGKCYLKEAVESLNKNNHPFEIFFTLFSAEKGFHPKSSPVLWLILMAAMEYYQ